MGDLVSKRAVLGPFWGILPYTLPVPGTKKQRFVYQIAAFFMMLALPGK